MKNRVSKGDSRAYLMWALGMAGYIFAAACRSSLSASGTQAAEQFHTTSAALSSFVYLQLFVYAIMQIPAGVLLDRFGPRRLITSGCLLMAIGQALMALALSTPVAVLGRAIVGAGDATIFISVVRLSASWFPLRKLPLINQLTGQIGSVGQIISVYPFVWLMDAQGWTAAFLTASGAGVFIAFCVMFCVRDNPNQYGSKSGTAGKRIDFHAVLGGLRKALRVPGTFCGFWVHNITWFSNSVMSQLWGIPFLMAVEQYTKQQASAFLAIGVVLCLLWAVPYGQIAAKHPVHGRAIIVYASVTAQMLVWAVLLVVPGPHPVWLLGLLLIALSSGVSAASVAFDYVRDTNEIENLGSATGFANIGGFLSSGLALLGVGVLLDAQHASTPALYTSQVMRVAFCVQFPLWIIGLIGFTVTLPGTLRIIKQRFRRIREDLASHSDARSES